MRTTTRAFQICRRRPTGETAPLWTIMERWCGRKITGRRQREDGCTSCYLSVFGITTCHAVDLMGRSAHRLCLTCQCWRHAMGSTSATLMSSARRWFGQPPVDTGIATYVYASVVVLPVAHRHHPPLGLGFEFRGGFSPVHTTLVVVSGRLRIFLDVSGSAGHDHAV